MKSFGTKMRQGLDRAIYDGRFKQFLWIFGALVISFLFLLLVSWVIGFSTQPDENVSAVEVSGTADAPCNSIRIIELMLDPGAFVGSNQYGHMLFQLFAVLIGSIVFTSFLIGAIGNLLNRRVESITNGHYYYDFEDHILILGASGALENLLLQIGTPQCDIVIQTSGNVEAVRESIMSYADKKLLKNIYVVFGKRINKGALENLRVTKAKSIYIIGEDDEQQHDGLNLKSWHYISQMCTGDITEKNCFLLLDRFTTHNVFSYKDESGSSEKLKLNVINTVENAAQSVLVSGEIKGIRYPFLDRGGIDKNSDIQVHFIVVGMTQIAYAMATTAAHICHFPNFRTKNIRTKITFIKKDIQEELDFWMGHFDSLMDLSYAERVSWDDKGKKHITELYPKSEYVNPVYSDNKGFLDVEWEFIDAGVEDMNVREYIRSCVKADGKTEYLSFAFCNHDAESNVAAAMYLPKEVYATNNIPVFVYQPLTRYVLSAAKTTDRFSNMYPFGMRTDCFDPLQKRNLWAKRIKFIYDKSGTYDEMEKPDDLDSRWYDKENRYVDQLSNIYAANSIPAKFRSIGLDPVVSTAISAEDVELLAETEHNRWNVEKLLNGFSALPYIDRMDIILGLLSKDEDVNSYAALRKKTLKTKHFCHPDIAPYDELLSSSKSYDSAIVANLLDVIK